QGRGKGGVSYSRRQSGPGSVTCRSEPTGRDFMSELPSTVVAGTAALGAERVQSASLAERWYVLIMMCLVYTMSIADRYVVSTVLEPIRLELPLTDSGVAWLTGAAFVLL